MTGAALDQEGVPSTGHPRADEVIAALAATRDAPPAEQIAPLAEAHRALRETLDGIGDV
ncbi:MAG TPA: hypothetical protein VF163_09165 [Micromonosporaceae bacterium]